MSGQVKPLLAVTAGDPAGVGPEILLKMVASWGDPSATDPSPAEQQTTGQPGDCGPASDRPNVVLIAEQAALASVRDLVEPWVWSLLQFVERVETSVSPRRVQVLDPVRVPREVVPGVPDAAGATAALRSIDEAIALVESGVAGAMVTGPVSKANIARWERSDFRGHTEYLAEHAGQLTYGRDYLMCFLTPDQQIALLSTHLPLADAIAGITTSCVVEALVCLHRHAGGRIALAGLNPHAGEGGLLGPEDEAVLVPAVAEAQRLGVDVIGPMSPDSMFSQLRGGHFDWVLALYHDQGLIPIKTVSFGESTNWTLGLPFLRTSVDHGTAFDIAGQGVADVRPLLSVLETTCGLVSGKLPRR